MAKICENCNNEIEEDAEFCPNCGFKVSGEDMRICPVCNSQNGPDSKFCTNCGFNLDDDYREAFATTKKFSNIVQENSSEDYLKKRESIKAKGDDVLHDNLPDTVIDKGADGASKTNRYLGKLKAKTIEKSNNFLNDNLPEEYVAKLKNGANGLVKSTEDLIEDTTTVVTNIHEHRKPIKEQKKLEKQRINEEKRLEREQKVLDRYDELAKEFGLEEEDYFLTSVLRRNFSDSTLRANTFIDGFFVIKDDKFIFEEIGNRDFKKAKAASTYIYFDQIVSMRLIKSVGDDRFEDITKTTATSLHDTKMSLKTSINSVKSMRFKELISNNDNKAMFDMIIIRTVDNTSYEFRLLSLDIGKNLVQLFDAWKKENNSPNVVVQAPAEEKSKADLIREYDQLLKDGLITKEEFDELKKELLFNK